MATRQTKRFLALLRGINVGGQNIIAKDALKQAFEDLGCGNVRKTTMHKLHSSPAYQQVTVRNHNTVFKLLELFDSI